MKWHDKALVLFFVLLIGVGFGYGWRMHHESIAAPSDYLLMPPNSLTISELSYEIGKGYEFWLPVNNDTMLHFLPLKNAVYEMAIRREPRSEENGKSVYTNKF
jgi:hypothetical protein